MSVARQPVHANEIRRRRPPDPERVESIKRSVELDIALNELRERRGITQAHVAAHLETSRPNVSRIEHEGDVRLSTLQRYVRALGGELEIVVKFDDGRVTVLGSDETVSDEPLS